MTTPIIVDCDTGIDDSLALLYACASPDGPTSRSPSGARCRSYARS